MSIQENNPLVGMEATEERKQIVRETIGRIAVWVKQRKMEVPNSSFTEEGALGFNLACDFLSHELMRMHDFHHKDVLK